MVTNIGFDRSHPYFEEAADEGRFVLVGDRLAIETTPTMGTLFTIERSVDGGDTWESVLGETESVSGAALMDWESLSYGDTLYRATATTVEGATAVAEITVPARSTALWLSGGVGYSLTCRLPLNPGVSVSGGRATSPKMFAGRTKPVIYKGEALSKVYQITGNVTDRESVEPNASPDELMELVRNPESLHMLRTPDGERVFGSVPGVNLGRESVTSHTDELRPWNAFWGYQFELTEGTDA